jgi:hypothetical protein
MMATDYKGSRDVQVPPGCNPNGLEMIHGPKAKNGGPAQDRFWMSNCFDYLY